MRGGPTWLHVAGIFAAYAVALILALVADSIERKNSEIQIVKAPYTAVIIKTQDGRRLVIGREEIERRAK